MTEKKTNRINTNAMFQNMLGIDAEAQNSSRAAAPGTASPTAGKPDANKNIQISVYMPPAQATELRVQAALKEKEKDKSAIVRVGLDIAMKMSSGTYHRMKKTAEAQGLTPGELVENILSQQLQ